MCINKLKNNITVQYMITYKMISNVYMLGSRMLYGVLGQIDFTCVITFNKNVIKRYFEVSQLLFDPKYLATTKTCNHIFSFGCGKCNRVLFLATPRN